MSTFCDAQGTFWNVNLRTENALKVRQWCTFKDGTPIDLLELSDTGKLWRVFESTETMINVVFVMCFDQISRDFSEESFDNERVSYYTMFPREKAKTSWEKAQIWFASRLDGKALQDMLKAFREAVLLFIPSLRQREALEAVLNGADRLEEANTQAAIRMAAEREATERGKIKESLDALTAGKTFGNTQES